MKTRELKSLIVTTDGGCLGNGTAFAKGYFSFQVEAVAENASKIGKHERRECQASTNNEAEYLAIIEALTYIDGLLERIGKPAPVTVQTDSALVVGQLTDGWKIKAVNLKDLHKQAAALVQKTGATIKKVNRETIVSRLGH